MASYKKKCSNCKGLGTVHNQKDSNGKVIKSMHNCLYCNGTGRQLKHYPARYDVE